MTTGDEYTYRPALFFACAYLFTWVFWIPAFFVSDEAGSALMLIGLFAPAIVSTVFVLVSGSDELKQDFRNKITGFYKLRWGNLFLAIIVFTLIVVVSILASLLFGQPASQFSFTDSFSFTGVGIWTAFATITLASIIEEIGWKGYCEDSLGEYMNWFWASLIFGVLWSLWHLPLIFIEGTYQAALMANPVYAINFFISVIPSGYIITWVYLASDRSILACVIFHLYANFVQEKIAMTQATKCIETAVFIVAAIIIVLCNRKMFFETEHVGRLLKTRFGRGA